MSENAIDKAALVTGASRGLGAQVALELARHGYAVALLARSAPDLDRVAAEIRAAGGLAEAFAVDLSDVNAAERAVAEAHARFGRLDALFNVAGAKVEGRAERASLDDARRAMDVNYLAPLALCRAAIPLLRRSGGGHIFNVSSVLGLRATPARGLYSASKAALNAVTEALLLELAGSGIRVTLVCPGRLTTVDEPRSWLAMDEAAAARRMVRCLAHPRRRLTLTLAGRALSGLNRLSPALADWVLARCGRGRLSGRTRDGVETPRSFAGSVPR